MGGQGARWVGLWSLLWVHHSLALRTARSSPRDTVLIQGTNRPVLNESTGNVTSDWLSALQVSEYARRQGYTYRMYLYGPRYEDACRHPERGPLLAQWCKLLAIRLAMREFPGGETYVWVDTDALINDMSWTIEDVMRYKPTVRYQNITSKAECTIAEPPEGRAQVSIFAWRNSGWDGRCGPNSGVMIIRNTATARRFLEDWWGIAMQVGIPGPYDQGYLHRFLYAEHPDKVAVFEEESLHRSQDVTFVKHSCRMCRGIDSVSDAFRTYVKNQSLGGHNISASLDPLSSEVLHPLLDRLQGSVDTRIRDGALPAMLWSE